MTTRKKIERALKMGLSEVTFYYSTDDGEHIHFLDELDDLYGLGVTPHYYKEDGFDVVDIHVDLRNADINNL